MHGGDGSYGHNYPKTSGTISSSKTAKALAAEYKTVLKKNGNQSVNSLSKGG